MTNFPDKDNVINKIWNKPEPPERVLIIRFHAAGDVVSTLPACLGLRNLLPHIRMDYLTGEFSAELPEVSGIFDNVYSLRFYNNNTAKPYGAFKKHFLKIRTKFQAVKLARKLRNNSYDVIIDLQHNRNSDLVRKIINPEYYSQFDRYSPIAHSKRVMKTFETAGFSKIKEDFNIKINNDAILRAREILISKVWAAGKPLIALNPAGLWITRNWNLENYVSLARLLSDEIDAQFIIIGDKRISRKADYVKQNLGNNVINLSGKTTLGEAYALLKHCSLIISEDSALAHMSWSLGVPTILMLGSTRSDWTCHNNDHVLCLNSSDLECGSCMEAVCKYGDVRCLERYTPQFIFEKALDLLKNCKAL